MMDAKHPRHPSFGLRWDFIAGADLGRVAQLERHGFSHWSLRLETFLKYGGPLSAFLEERMRHSQVRFFSDYLPAVPRQKWDDVHRLATVALLEKTGALRVSCRGELPELPGPQNTLAELARNLPLSVELAIHSQNERMIGIVRRSSEVAASILVNDWMEDFRFFSEYADLVNEVEVDLDDEKLDCDRVAEVVRYLLEGSSVNTALDVTFILPLNESRYEYSIERAVRIREKLFRDGWRSK